MESLSLLPLTRLLPAYSWDLIEQLKWRTRFGQTSIAARIWWNKIEISLSDRVLEIGRAIHYLHICEGQLEWLYYAHLASNSLNLPFLVNFAIFVKSRNREVTLTEAHFIELHDRFTTRVSLEWNEVGDLVQKEMHTKEEIEKLISSMTHVSTSTLSFGGNPRIEALHVDLKATSHALSYLDANLDNYSTVFSKVARLAAPDSNSPDGFERICDNTLTIRWTTSDQHLAAFVYLTNEEEDFDPSDKNLFSVNVDENVLVMSIPDPDRIKLDCLKRDSLKWNETADAARKFWLDFEALNSNNLDLVLTLAKEIAKRKSSISDFYLAYVYSNTQNIQANLYFLDYINELKNREQWESVLSYYDIVIHVCRKGRHLLKSPEIQSILSRPHLNNSKFHFTIELLEAIERSGQALEFLDVKLLRAILVITESVHADDIIVVPLSLDQLKTFKLIVHSPKVSKLISSESFKTLPIEERVEKVIELSDQPECELLNSKRVELMKVLESL